MNMAKISSPSNLWPKSRPALSEEQKRIVEDWYSYWLTVLPKSFGLIDRFDHRYSLRTLAPGIKTLEIGAGVGAHLRFESLENQEYVALELRPELAEVIRASYPAARVIIGDCQEEISFPDGYFDRVLAIHLLEHLSNLPKALDQVQRVLRPGGFFSVVIPCEGGFAYRIGRKISVQRIFERRYNQSYDWLIAYDHINRPGEIISELRSRFQIVHQAYFPLLVPITDLNLVIGLTLTHLKPNI